jgi:lipoic acid synthetase
MAALFPRYRCLSCRLSNAKPSFRALEFTSSISSRRNYATAAEPSTAPCPARRTTKFDDRLNTGPSFSDFVGGKAEEPMTRDNMLELRTAMVGPEGKKKKITRLPEWLKTPIPVSNNYKKIKNDLRGLNLHTGGTTYVLK